MGLSNNLSFEAGSFPCCLNTHRVFFVCLFVLVKGFEAFFPHNGTLGSGVHLAPQLFLLAYLHANVGSPTPPAVALTGPPATVLLESSPTQVPVSTPPASLDECSFFNSLVVELPYSLIFWQSGYLFVFICAVVFLLVVRGGKVYLPMPPSWLEVS